MVDLRAESHVRLKKAVRRNRALSREGLLERLFERLFRGLVYTQIWEDPEIDLAALAIEPESHVVAIASGGCNVLSYLTAGPARITAVDLSLAHVALNRLKLVAASRLPSWEAFHRFFGAADVICNRLHALSRPRIRARFEERFTARRMANEYLEIYRGLLASAAPRLRVVAGKGVRDASAAS